MTRYRLRRGALFTGPHRYDFVGTMIESHVNENNGRMMYRLAFPDEPGRSLWLRCWFYLDDLVEVVE